MPKRAEKVIEDPAFKQEKELTVDDVKRLIVPSYDEAATTLIPGWKGSPILLVGVKLDQDGKTIQNCEPVLAGKLFKKTARSFAASKFWSFKDKYFLKLQPIDLRLFQFTDTLVSNVVDSSQIAYSFVDKDGNDVFGEVLSDQGYKGFCIRLYAVPTSAAEAKVKLVLYPVTKDDLEADQPYQKDPRFTGLLITSTDIEIGVRYTEIFDKSFGSPICPVVLTDVQKENLTEIPPTGEFLSKIASMLRAAAHPETKQGHESMWERWAEIKKDGANKLVRMAVSPVWPEYEWPVTVGNNYYLFIKKTKPDKSVKR